MDDLGRGAQQAHHLPPFHAMRPYPAMSVERRDHVMGHLVRHGTPQAVIERTSKEAGVESQLVLDTAPGCAVLPILAGGAAAEIESGLWHGQ